MNAGAIDSEMTTIIGCEEPVKTHKAFQIIKGKVIKRRDHRIKVKVPRGFCHFGIILTAVDNIEYS